MADKNKKSLILFWVRSLYDSHMKESASHLVQCAELFPMYYHGVYCYDREHECYYQKEDEHWRSISFSVIFDTWKDEYRSLITQELMKEAALHYKAENNKGAKKILEKVDTIYSNWWSHSHNVNQLLKCVVQYDMALTDELLQKEGLQGEQGT